MKALIAMSGGVDSSIAALLMKEKGYDCIGCTMKLYESATQAARTCCSLNDVEDARSVAYQLGMLYYVFNFKDDFYGKVIEKFIRCYENGVTPNPCIDCNRYMKFEKLFLRAQQLGCEKIVTGHYARIEQKDGKYVLKKALDDTKDQSYVLYSMTQQQLAQTVFPLGTLTKTEARRLAKEHGFDTADKPDSQDICFVPDGNYAEVIRSYTGKADKEGLFRSVDGKVLGRHKGIIHYTVGQRRGLGISAPQPLYVCRLCPETNEVILGSERDLYSKTAVVGDFHWISGELPTTAVRCRVKVRYRQTEQPATVFPLADKKVRIEFDTPQRAVTPGQSAVLYDGDTVLGGGEILYAQKGEETI